MTFLIYPFEFDKKGNVRVYNNKQKGKDSIFFGNGKFKRYPAIWILSFVKAVVQ